VQKSEVRVRKPAPGDVWLPWWLAQLDPMKTTMTEKQLAANRRNALKSTGPKTARGQAMSAGNALKHGLLSREVLVRGQRGRESAREFAALREGIFENLAPVGPMETMLVERIVTTQWRLRRALRAESGEIALNVDRGAWSRNSRASLRLALGLPTTPFGESLVQRLEKSTLGVHYLIHCLQEVRGAVAREGELSEAILADYKKSLRGEPDATMPKLEALRTRFLANAEGLAPEVARQRHCEEAAGFLDRQIRLREFQLHGLQAHETAVEASQQSADVLPSAETLDKILRYETTLERSLYRAMHQLERLQRSRRGEAGPAPAVVEVVAKDFCETKPCSACSPMTL
jgi:hypothetical protein